MNAIDNPPPALPSTSSRFARLRKWLGIAGDLASVGPILYSVATVFAGVAVAYFSGLPWANIFLIAVALTCCVVLAVSARSIRAVIATVAATVAVTALVWGLVLFNNSAASSRSADSVELHELANEDAQVRQRVRGFADAMLKVRSVAEDVCVDVTRPLVQQDNQTRLRNAYTIPIEVLKRRMSAPVNSVSDLMLWNLQFEQEKIVLAKFTAMWGYDTGLKAERPTSRVQKQFGAFNEAHNKTLNDIDYLIEKHQKVIDAH